MPSISSPAHSRCGSPSSATVRRQRRCRNARPHVNRRWGREVVKFVGPMHDPRPAYAAADVVLGMGSSALRALSIGRPVVVQGEDGFSKVFEPATLPYFLRATACGGDAEAGWTVQRLAEQLSGLLSDPRRRAELGAFGRRTVEDRFSLSRAVGTQLDIYSEVLARGRRASSPTQRAPHDALCGSSLTTTIRAGSARDAIRSSRCSRRRAGWETMSHTLESPHTTAVDQSRTGDWDGLIVLCAANSWDAVKLADRHMAEPLTAHAPVLYVDPPISHLTRFKNPAVAASAQTATSADGRAPYSPLHADRRAEASAPGDDRV